MLIRRTAFAAYAPLVPLLSPPPAANAGSGENHCPPLFFSAGCIKYLIKLLIVRTNNSTLLKTHLILIVL